MNARKNTARAAGMALAKGSGNAMKPSTFSTLPLVAALLLSLAACVETPPASGAAATASTTSNVCFRAGTSCRAHSDCCSQSCMNGECVVREP